MERAEGQTPETALPGRLHLSFLRHHGTLEPRIGLGLPRTRFGPQEIVFHLQSKNEFKKISFQKVDETILIVGASGGLLKGHLRFRAGSLRHRRRYGRRCLGSGQAAH